LEANFTRPCKYAEWISSIVPIDKNGSSKVRVCIDLRNLNSTTPKYEYAMPIADMLTNEASGHRVISFLDSNAGYNQIFMTKKDTYNMSFRCPDFVRLFEWVVMIFGLKIVGASYQWDMNLFFHDFVGIIVKVYIDVIVFKSAGLSSHLVD
jgi:hypothetical protein